MAVAIATSLIGLVVVLVAYYRDEPLEERRLHYPRWDLLPDPADLARIEFPLSFPGYDPATVEVHFETLARAYADLLAVAPADVVARARRRAALRQGVEMPGPASDAVQPGAAPEPPDDAAAVATPPEAPDAEALRAEAALADLDAHHSEGTP